MNTSDRRDDNAVAAPWLKHRFGRIWRFGTDVSSRSSRALDKVCALPAPVLERAARFAQAEDRERYLHAHQVLHTVLEPIAPRWLVSAHGKPSGGAAAPAFNLSRRGNWAAFIVGSDARPLGLDLEVMHEIDDPVELAHEVFTPAEIAELQALPEDQRSRAFLRGWTRKEAVMKAVGLGVSLAPRSFHVGLDAAPLILGVSFMAQSFEVELECLPDEDPTLIAVARVVVA